jgi:hypothetical protein
MKHATRSVRDLIAVLTLAVLAVSPLIADNVPTPEDRGMAIAVEADRRDTGFGDFTAALTMVLRNRQGQESRRAMRTRNLEQESDGDKSLVVFDEPNDVKGTALLTFSHKTGDDDQWLFLPALKRVKRISSSNKSGPFVGSEFAYEDIGSQEVEEYTYKFVREEALEGMPMFVIERYPVDPRSGYTKQVVWIDQEEYRTWRVEFFDRKNEPLKTLSYSDYRRYLDQYWRPDFMAMVNHQTGKSTDLLWHTYEFRTGLTDAELNRATLARAK